MANPAKVSSKKDGYAFLRHAFEEEQNLLYSKLCYAKNTITHDGIAGSVGEDHWIKLLRKYLPRRYSVDNAIIIDSRGQTSDQIDIVIYDPQYTPTLLTQESHRYVPAEALYAVFEVKPVLNKTTLEYAGKKAFSVRNLHRTSVPITHAGGTFKPREPFPIISGILTTKTEWADGLGNTFEKVLSSDEMQGDCSINCGLSIEHGAFDTFDKVLTKEPKNNALVFFLFRLLNKLQSLGTVPAIDWNSYAQIFVRP